MDEQQGNVIDGRARVRHWRGPAAKHGDDPLTRSEAPKSIAGSLLVPAEMLPANEQAEQVADPGPAGQDTAAALGEHSAEEGVSQNPFLLAEAGAENGRRRQRRFGARARSRPPGRVLLGSLGALVVGVTAVFAASGGSSESAHHQKAPFAGSGPPLAAATLNAFSAIRPALLADSQLGGQARGTSPARAQRQVALKPAPRDRSADRPRPRVRNRRMSSARGSAAVAVSATSSSQTASPGGVSTAAAPVPVYQSGASSSSATSATGSHSTGSSSNGGSQTQPAFGEFGALGPGHSPQG